MIFLCVEGPVIYKMLWNMYSEFCALQLYPYQCHTCHRAFPRNYSLKRHQLLHASDKKYICETCGHQFSHVHNRDRLVTFGFW